MSKTYAQIIEQIDILKEQAEKLRRKETEGVVARIREAIAAYGLTPADLGLSAAGTRKKTGKKPGPKPGFKRAASGVRYRDNNGNSWSGRGPRPRWLREALLSGKTLADLTV